MWNTHDKGPLSPRYNHHVSLSLSLSLHAYLYPTRRIVNYCSVSFKVASSNGPLTPISHQDK